MSVEVKEVSQLDTVTLDNNSLIPVYTEENGLGKATLQSAKNVIGVEISSATAQASQGAVGSSASVNVTKGGTSQQATFDFAFSIPAPNEIDSITTVQDNTDSGTSVVTIETTDGNTESFNVKNGKGISNITEDNNTANGATRAITVTYSDGTTSALSVKNGEGIDSVTVNQSSSAGATSTMTLTMSNGTTQTLSVKNGKDFHIEKSYASIAAMEADFANMEAYGFVMIDTGSVEDIDTGKLYYKGTSQWEYVGDLSGKQGIKGDTGVGIASLSFSESQVSSGINVLTVTLTDGTTQTFNIRNGAKGDTGERGTGVFAGTDFSETGTSYVAGAGETICDQGLLIDSHSNSSSYTTSYKAGDIYIQTATNDVFKAVESVKSVGSGASTYVLYWQKIGNIQGKSVGSITAPSTVDTSNGAGNTYTVKDTDGNAIGTFTVYNANNTNADTLTTARNFTIADADGTNSGVSVSFDGSGNVTLHLPSTAKIDITGNATTATTANQIRTSNSNPANGDIWIE